MKDISEEQLRDAVLRLITNDLGITKIYDEHMLAYINSEHAKIINAADTLAKKALDYADAGKAIRYGDVVEAAREYRRVRGE